MRKKIRYWRAGDHIEDTRSAMVLEDLIGQFLYGNNDD